MVAAQWQLDASHGRLLLGTDVTGRAAKMGHRLAIVMDRWTATVARSGERPTAVALSVEVDSLRVLHGDGGLTPPTAPEKTLIRSNALKCLDAGKHKLIRFDCDDIEEIAGGYRLSGTLQIRGRTAPHVLEVHVTDDVGSWQVEGATVVRHSDFGVRRYSMLMGAMQVADEVSVSFAGSIASDGARGS